MNDFDDLLTNTQELSKEDYAAKKKAERDDVFALSDRVALGVAGEPSLFRQYLNVQSRFERYSAVNALLILAQEDRLPDKVATRLGSFEHWKDRGGSVKNGQTGLSILEPHEYTKEDGSPGIGYNVKKVFDISQVDTRRMKAITPPTYTERQLLQALIAKAPVTGVDELQQPAMTDPNTGNILVRKGMAFEDTFKYVAYELAHAEVDREQAADSSFTAYCASYILCMKYGVKAEGYGFANAEALLAGKTPQEIKAELSHIRDAAETISGRMLLEKVARNKDAR